MKLPGTIYVDTSGLLALVNAADTSHVAARRIESACREQRVKFVTSQLVLTEFLNAMAAVRARSLAVHALAIWQESAFHRIEQLTTTHWNAACRQYAAFPDKNWSLVDCSSFLLCKRRRLTHVLTADHHFRQAGFQILL
ncbi:MAG TPA: PIN domain-containing protein [Phycisphaerales bacterium]|nr:PIN domain-containing protein [Phycisphaerales bacterium]